MFVLRVMLVGVVIIQNVNSITRKAEDQAESRTNGRPQIEVRAVFIRCETEEENGVVPDNEASRFEREELFKHGAIRNCSRKLALSVKMSTESDITGDEYLPIEHVFEGPERKRLRLLNPYILRLRRQPALQAYKLRKIETISGVLTNPEDAKYNENIVRDQRDLPDVEHNLEGDLSNLKLGMITEQSYRKRSTLTTSNFVIREPRNCVRHLCANLNTTYGIVRGKRERNIVVEEADDAVQHPWDLERPINRVSRQQSRNSIGELFNKPGPNGRQNEDIQDRQSSRKEKKISKKSHRQPEDNLRRKHSSGVRNAYSRGYDSATAVDIPKENSDNPLPKGKDTRNIKPVEGKIIEVTSMGGVNLEPVEKDYTVYEIGNPELWYNMHVLLFEKLSTPEGITVWNDLSNGEQPIVGSTASEWSNQDLNVRYRAAEWITREEFTLPAASLCLLAPIQKRSSTVDGISENGGYIVIPKEEIEDLTDEGSVQKVEDTDGSSSVNDSEFTKDISKQRHRRVTLRPSRTLLKGCEDSMNVALYGAEKYLTLPHRRTHHAQVDIEARADDNELVRVGSSGRIAIAVADSTRTSRTIIMLQVGNTGLAAARFRVVAQDCGPEFTELLSDEAKAPTVAGPELIPPRHTRSLRIELPVELPVDEARCSVTLMNDEDKSVAVREVTIKKGDRCFCVWHCDCVCLGVDPKLICRAMTESRQLAAGLSLRDRVRHARSVCYPDVVPLNMCVVAFGVLLALLLLGFVKACLGIICRCVALWGLDWLLQTPRKLDHYYETSLRQRPVEYDDEGWPIHPDTKKRTVRQVSPFVEFILNIIFFVTVPSVVVYNVLKQICVRLSKSRAGGIISKTNLKSSVKKCFSSQDIQDEEPRWRHRRGGLRKWMTPGAQELSTQLWQDGLTPIKDDMRPLINQDCMHNASPTDMQDSCLDSEQDDTEYVLTQMQKSRESLAESKRKISEHRKCLKEN